VKPWFQELINMVSAASFAGDRMIEKTKAIFGLLAVASVLVVAAGLAFAENGQAVPAAGEKATGAATLQEQAGQCGAGCAAGAACGAECGCGCQNGGKCGCASGSCGAGCGCSAGEGGSISCGKAGGCAMKAPSGCGCGAAV